MSKLRKDIFVVGSTLPYRMRIVVPLELRRQNLSNLHSGHQGVTSMLARAQESVWWPRLGEDVSAVCQGCHQCDVNSLSQPVTKPKTQVSPLYAFQNIVPDFFTLKENMFCVVVD
jgi:hypothetical protein